MTNSIMDHVLRGAALLDEKGPRNWRDKIDLDKLKQNDVTQCVLGQVYGSRDSDASGYVRGKKELNLEIPDAGWHGFSASHTPFNNDQFTDAWKTYLGSMPPVEKPELGMTRELVKLMAKRFKQIDNPGHTLEEVKLVVDGVIIVLK